ncbi:MAG: histidine kinase [Pontiella sp.]
MLKALIALSLVGLSPAIAVDEDVRQNPRSLNQLEQRLTDLDGELAPLAHNTLRSGVGNLGWLSKNHKTSASIEWIEIQLDQEIRIDQIVLAPILWNDAQDGPRADGFPLAFKIIVGNKNHPAGFTAASFTEDDHLLPRRAPVSISIPPTLATWVRIEASKLSSWAWKPETYVFQLSEVMIFSEAKNVALHQSIKTSSEQHNYVAKAMYKEALVDGFMPYLMNTSTGSQSDPYIIFFKQGHVPSITIGLGQTLPIDGINLHTADLRENIPKIHHADYGLPKHLLIEGANRPDFSDAVALVEFHREQVYDTGPIITYTFPEINCRYIRLTALASYAAPEASGIWRCIGFAEIELISKGKNVAKGKLANINIEAPIMQGTIASLTDGRNHYGEILPIRTWINQLARRHTLERERATLVSEINKRYILQKSNLKKMTWLVALLTTGIVLFVWLEKYLHRRQVRCIKERFAADLHDEIGANLHTIGLLSDMAEEAQSAPEKLSDYLQRIRSVTERSSIAVRHVTDLNESTELFTGLKAEMQRAAERVVDKLEHDFLIEGEKYLPHIKQRIRIDLFLFYKECLINICRHAGATQLSTHLVITPKTIKLSIIDNGHGLPVSMQNGIPQSLKRRARLLRAKIKVDTPEEGGTRILLTLRPTRNRYRVQRITKS